MEAPNTTFKQILKLGKQFFVTLLISLFCFAFKGYSQTNKKPNILWITCEDMSLHLSCFGEKEISTPNLDKLASEGIKFTNVYTAAGVCAPSRSAIITGMYPSSIGTDNMRNYNPGKKVDVNAPVPSYSVVVPSYVKCFSEYLRENGYYCTNNPKEDYQFEAPVTAWDESSTKAHWRNRPEGKPFFSVFNLFITHESQLWARDKESLLVDPAKVIVPPYYPDVAEVRHDIARNLTNIIRMDQQVGKIIEELKQDGLYDNTIIFFYSDHGDGLPYVKREVLTRGLHIPLIVRFPDNKNAGTIDNELISGVDLAPTVLSLAGIPIPSYMQGQAFLGKEKSKKHRTYIYAARDRMDTEVDRVRAVFDSRYEYLRNYMPEKPYYQNIAYRLQIPMMRKILAMKDSGQLNELQRRWFRPNKPLEELYDTKTDPYEFHNLADDPKYKSVLIKLRAAHEEWMKKVGDRNAIPEKSLIKKMWNGKDTPPVTAQPVIIKKKNGVTISCATKGASIGFKIVKKGVTEPPASWTVYQSGEINLQQGDKLLVQAQRIGYEPAQATLLF